MKRTLRCVLIALLLASMLLALVACKDIPDDPVERPTDQTTESPTETETDIQPEPACAISLAAKVLEIADGALTLTLDCEVASAGSGKITAILTDAAGKIAEQELDATAGKLQLSLPCPDDRANGELTLTLTATDGDGVASAPLTLYTKGGLVQLSADAIDCVVAAMTLEEKAHMVTGTQNVVLPGASGGTYAIDRLGVPSATVNDGPAGLRYQTTVWYPSVINVSSSWDTSLAAQIGTAMGKDSLAKGVDVILAPGMNVQKNVLGGRNFEYCSEDPILTAYIAAAYTNGIQSTGVGVSLKHFAANNQESSRGSISANVTERALREIYLKAFGMVVRDADPYTVMSSYNLVNGKRVAVSYDLLTTYLRGECGFDGMVMSDWGSGGTVVEKVNAGNDINMPGNADDPDLIVAAAKDGSLNMQMLDTACANVLTLVVKSPVFTNPERPERIDHTNHGALAKEVAAQTMVLLKNEQTLPLSGEMTLAIFGNGAFATVYGGAGSGSVQARKPVCIADGLHDSDAFEIYNYKGHPFKKAKPHSATDPSLDIEVTEEFAKQSADNAAAAVIVISRSSTEGEDRSDIAGDFCLNATERDMIERVSAAFHAKGKKVIVLLNTGSPIEMLSWQDSVDAILWTGYAGERTGDAVASVLSGKINPSAKTTITWPATYASTPAAGYFPGTSSDTVYYEDIYVGYRYYSTFGVDVAYPFGYGLSYTTFAYDQFTAQKQADGTVLATCRVTNTGAYAGREIVQIYISKPETLQEQAKIELAGFAKTALLQPGESETVSILITADALETYDTQNSRYLIDGGEYVLSLATSATDIKATATVQYDTTVLRDVTSIASPDGEFVYIQKATYTVPQPQLQLPNLALNKPAYDNGHENDTYAAKFAVDGNATTRWSGLGCIESLHQFWVDLGQSYEIGRINVVWESISVPFTVSISEDGKTYSQIGTYTQDPMSGACELNLYGLQARYVKLSIPKGNFVSIFEFVINEATEHDKANRPDDLKKTNLALHAAATSSTCESGYVASNAVDGNMETRWGSLPTGDAWLQVDLGQTAKIGQISAVLESAWVPYFIEVSADGQTYTTVYSAKKDELFIDLADLDLEARYVRFRRDGENWFSIIELEIYE